MEYRYWKVQYIDTWTNGEIRETELHGYYDYNDVIKFFGLNEPEVSWYKVEEIEDYDSYLSNKVKK